MVLALADHEDEFDAAAPTWSQSRHGSRGVHLLVGHSNQRAIGFYRHIGFTELSATGVHIFGLNLTEEMACR